MKRSRTKSQPIVGVLETLEERRLLTATPYVINGTEHNDTITVSLGITSTTTQTQAHARAHAVAATGSAASSVLSQAVITINGNTTVTTIDLARPITINGLGGGDLIKVYGNRGVTIFGGSVTDNNPASSSDGADTIYGGDGPDYINGGFLSDVVYGNGGNDTIHGGGREDTIHGGAGNDNLYGDESQDVVYGDTGDDYLNGGAFNAGPNGGGILIGGLGADTYADGTADYSGGTAHLSLTVDGIANDGEANEHDNILSGSVGIIGGSANDFISAEHSGFGMTLEGRGGDDVIMGSAHNDVIRGDDGNDICLGLDGDDVVSGGRGDDFLYGNGGEDSLFGDDGIDHLDPGDGKPFAAAEMQPNGAGWDVILQYPSPVH